MPDVFVSYSRLDRDVARGFANGFEREGLSVWWDQAIHPGEAFDQVTEQALEEARAVVLLWSKSSVQSRWVRAEATQAHESHRLIPVTIEPCRRPIIFELVHTIDLTGWTGDRDDPTWRDLVSSVQRMLGRPGHDIARPTHATARPESGTTHSRTGMRRGLRRRELLLYGASAVGFGALGLGAGAQWRGRVDSAQEPSPNFHRLTFRRGLIRSARFGPDGATILYGALWDGHPCRAYVTRIDNPESRALDLPVGNLLAVSSNGELALSLGANLDGVFTYGTLARVPMEGGAPRALVENVKFADWSPDGSALAVVRNVDGIDQLEYPLGRVLFRPKANDGTGLGFARVAPDGERIAFIHYMDPQSLVGRLCVLDRRGTPSALTDRYVNIHGLAWHGEAVWFSASDDRPLFRSLHAVAPGHTQRTVARMPVNVTLWDVAADGRLLIAQTDDRTAMISRIAGEVHDRDLSWLDASWAVDLSPDGRQVLFGENGQGVGAVPAAYLRGTDGSPAVRLASGWPLALAPDASRVLVANDDQKYTDSKRYIDIVPTGVGETRRVPGRGYSHLGARWLGDGQNLIVKAAEDDRPMRLYRVHAGDGRYDPLTPEGVGAWALSPDGRTVAAAGPGPGIQLYPVAGGAARTVPTIDAGDRLVAWIHDGLLVMRLNDPTVPLGDVYLVDSNTGQRRSWGNILPRDSAGIMLMGRLVVTPDGRTSVFTWHRALSNLYLADGLA